MALRFMEGFDQFNNESGLAAKLATAGYTTGGIVGIADGRGAVTRALSIGSGAAAGSLRRTFASGQNLVVLGFAYRATNARAQIVSIDGVVTLGWDAATGRITISGSAGQATIVLSVWYYFEIVIDKTLGEIRVHINNELDLTVALPSGAAFVTSYVCNWTTASDVKLLDDVVFIDSATGTYTNRIGPVQITARVPSVDVDAEWSAATGNDRYEMVNNIPVIPSQFIQSNSSGAFSTFLSNTPVQGQDAILAVGVVVVARKSDVDNRQIGLVVGTKNGARKEVLQPTLATTDTYSYAVFETGLGNVPWTDETVSDTPFGVVVRP